ncbi:MAG: hypothetical protein ACKVS5_12660 [Parvularculaceae bacterium]
MTRKQKLDVAVGRMSFAHAMFWALYSMIVILVVPRVHDLEGFDSWPVPARLALALAPVAPVALWMAASARFLARLPDELIVQQTHRATATAGGVTLLVLFAQGWVDLIAGPGVWPRLVFEGFDTTPWVYVSLFGVVWTVAVNRQNRRIRD